MDSAPLILVSPSTEQKGREFYDYSLSLSEAYLDALTNAGGLPVVIPCNPSEKLVAEYVRRTDGVMLTGGDDLQPELYAKELAPELRATVKNTDPKRDALETLMVREAMAQKKPLLAICRGHQILNVALGGTLVVDIPMQLKTDLNHSQLEHRDRVVHSVNLAPDSMLVEIFGRETIEVNSSHHQAIERLAGPLRVTGRSSDGIIEVVELRPEEAGLLPYLLSVQFHPERLVRGYPEYLKLFRSFVGACGDECKVEYEGQNIGRG